MINSFLGNRVINILGFCITSSNPHTECPTLVQDEEGVPVSGRVHPENLWGGPVQGDHAHRLANVQVQNQDISEAKFTKNEHC